jgi:uncharacterized 2Fe-2S/4Fe-4S cluster protein (DUF4445 family)
MPCTITFTPAGLTVICDEGTPLLEAARRAGMLLYYSCGGNGICGRCRVRIRSEDMQSPTAEERQQLTAADLADGYRLACQVRIAGDTTVDIPFPFLTFLQTIPLPDVQIDLLPIEASVHDCAVEMTDAHLDDTPALWKALAAELRQMNDQDDVAVGRGINVGVGDRPCAGEQDCTDGWALHRPGDDPLRSFVNKWGG